MTFTVYAYFNVLQLATLFDAVTAITSSANYMDLLRTVFMIGFMVFVVGMAVGKAQEPLEFFRWLIIVMLVHLVLLVPKVDVTIEDRTGAMPATVRSNVPIGLAVFASVTSHVGDWLTRASETVFALPDDLQYQKNGVMFGNTVLVNTLKARSGSPEFETDLTNFIVNCSYYDILAGRISSKDFVKATDLWAKLADTSNTLLTPMSTDTSGSMTCKDAYTDISTRMVAETKGVLATIGHYLNPNAANDVVASTLAQSQIAAAYKTLTDVSKSATDILRQNMVVNAARNSQMISAQKLDDKSSMMAGAAQAQAEQTTELNYTTAARIAEKAAPVVRNIVEMIAYAVFPIIILLAIVAGEHAKTVLKGYVMTLVWLQLIAPLYAVLNYIMVSFSSSTLIGVASADNPVKGVNIYNLQSLAEHGLSDMAIAGYMTLSIPVIAWAIVKSGEIGGGALFGAAMAGASSASQSSSNEIGAGNINQGNVNLDNSSANNTTRSHYDVAPSINSGYFRNTGAAGTAIYGSDGTYRFQANQSSLGFGANFGQKIGNALSSDATLRNEAAEREAVLAAQSQAAALTERIGIMRAWAQNSTRSGGSDISHNSHSGKALATLTQIASGINKRMGLSEDDTFGTQVVIGSLAKMGTQIGLSGKLDSSKLGGGSPGSQLGAGASLPKGGKIGKVGKLGGALDILVGGGFTIDAGLTKLDNEHESHDKKYDDAIAFAQNSLKSNGLTLSQALNEDFKSTDAYQWARQNRSESVKAEDSALTTSTQHARNSEAHRSEAFALSEAARTVNENWLHYSMNYEGYVANRLRANGQLEAFNQLYQSNPDAAARLAAGYLRETNFDVMPQMQPVTADMTQLQNQSPALAGRSVDATYATALDSVPNEVGAAQAGNDGKVRAQGYRTEPVVDTVSPEVAKQRAKIKVKVDGEGNDVDQSVKRLKNEYYERDKRRTEGVFKKD